MLSVEMVIWLLLLVFVLHDGEEVLMMPGWARRNVDVARRLPQARLIAWGRPITPQFAVAVTVAGAVVLAASWVGHLTFVRAGRMHGLFVGVLAVMLLDGAKHVLLTVAMRRYSPGAVTAALLELPFALYAFFRLAGAGMLTTQAALGSGLIGLALVPVVLGTGFTLGRWLAGSVTMKTK